ncbi:MAG: hypothetical protein R6U11_02465 [Bacteroidales bacterium]
MKPEINIELFEEHEKVTYYTLRISGEETEIEKFFDKFPENSDYNEDINIIISWIDTIGENGAMERYFRYEGKYKDRVFAIPVETTNIRLYVLRLSENIIILGNGGIKKTATYNEDSILRGCVELLQKVDSILKSRISNNQITIYGKNIFGNTILYLD